MHDIVALTLTAGDGGHGKVSFRREKFIPKGGPDGGSGGKGGDILVVADPQLHSLSHLAGIRAIEAKPGQKGGKKNMFGGNAEDRIIRVPVGTKVWLWAENRQSRNKRFQLEREGIFDLSTRIQQRRQRPLERYHLLIDTAFTPDREPLPLELVTTLDIEGDFEMQTAEETVASQDTVYIDESQLIPLLRDLKVSDWRTTPRLKLATLDTPGQQMIVCAGGRGGKGNAHFKRPDNTTPLEAEYGEFGEKKVVVFEMTLLADIGFVGWPNVGKSTLLSVLTGARPKIADYPFTTLEPNIGVMSVDRLGDEVGRSVVLADIPGLIEGASQGKGLGFSFLRHIEHCQAVVLVVAPELTWLTNPEALASDDSEVSSQQSLTEKISAQIWQEYSEVLGEMREYSPELVKKPLLVVLNKTDILTPEQRTAVVELFVKNGVTISQLSAGTKEGMTEFRNQLWEMVTATSNV